MGWVRDFTGLELTISLNSWTFSTVISIEPSLDYRTVYQAMISGQDYPNHNDIP